MLERFMRYPGFLTKAVTLSYDDNTDHDRKMVEMLNRCGLKCTFNVNSGRLGQPGRITVEEMVELYKGHEVAVHGLTHPHLDNLSVGQATYQILEDRKNLERILNRPVEGMAYPFHIPADPAYAEAVRCCSIKYSRVTESTYRFDLPSDYLRWCPTCHHAEPELPGLVEKFLQPDDIEHPWRITCRLLFVWGHSYEYEDHWDDLERLCKLLSGYENVWYATNEEIIDYVIAYRQLRSSVDGTMLHNPTATTLYTSINNRNYTIYPGETLYI